MVYVCPKFDAVCPDIEAHRCRDCPRPRRLDTDEISALRAKLAEAQVKLESAELDVARYRWIRDMNQFNASCPQPPCVNWWTDVLGNSIGEDFDNIIDAVRGGK